MKKQPIFWILKQIRSRIPALALMTVAQILSALLSVFFALGSRAVIDSAVAGNGQDFGFACLKQGGIIAGILLSMVITRHLRDRLQADLEKDWKRHLLHCLLHGDYAQVAAYHSGELLNRLNNDVTKVNEGLLGIVPNAAAMITRLAAAVAVLGVLDGQFTLLMLLLGLLIFLVTGFMRRYLKNLNKRVSEHDGKVSSFLQEVMEKLLMVQTMDVCDEVERRAEDLLQARYALQRKRKNVSLLTNTGISVLSHGAGFMALVWCAYRVLLGQMSFGSLTAVTQLVSQLRAPFVNMSGVLPQYIAMVASAERLMELDDIDREPETDAQDIRPLYDRMDAICAEALCFAYDREPVLQNADFTIPKGAFCVISGPSGVGKSTLLKLLLGVFQPEKGKLYLRAGAETVPLLRNMRRLFAYVPQGNLLLSGTVRDNLLIAKPDATDAQLQQALYVSAMDAYVPQLPQGLETVLGESGAGLSEGQAQRLAIARAILGGAPVLLLDESTSALDSETEMLVLQRIRQLPDRTCIVVTHRPAALALCDWNLELQDGIVKLSQETGNK